MRKLAIVSFSFSAAVFGANYLLPESTWLPLGILMALLCPVCWRLLRGKKRRAALALSLCCAGLAFGCLWTAAYTAVWFQPARDLADQTIRMEATVKEWPQPEEYGWSVPVQVETDSFVTLTAILYTDEQGAGLRPGDKISTVARCILGDRTFSGEEITYYTAKGVFLRATAYGGLEVERPDRIPFRHWAAVLSKALKDSIDAAFPEDAAPLVRALVTGNRDNLTDEFTSSLQRTGLSHTVAVSGMHLAFLACLVTLVLGRGKRSTTVAVVVWVLLFCGVAGNTPSVLRAAVMILLLQIAPLLGRERDGATALGLALLLLLLWNPYSAAHVGLQLSFAAVAGILLVSDGIQDWMLGKLGLKQYFQHWPVRLLAKIPTFFVSTLSATLGASVFTIPLVALHFQTFSLISPLSNLLTLWAVAILFMGGLLTGVLGLFIPGAVTVLTIPFTCLARYLDWIIGALGRVPLASIPLDSFYYRAWVVFLCVLLGLTLGSREKKRLILLPSAAAFTLCLSMLFQAGSFRSEDLSAAVLDVGQGQSVLFQVDHYLTLVDCGGDARDNAGDIAADYIQALGRTSLDLLVVTHYHTDHANGIPQLLKRVDVSAIALPDVEADDALRREILALAEERNIEVWFIREDTTIFLGEDQELTLYPPLEGGTETNELGLTVLVRSGDCDALLTGDMGGETEQQLLDYVPLPDIELLVVGHHGSKYSTTEELLAAVQPETAVISVGADNRYGHPAQETLDRLASRDIAILRTDRDGHVLVRY